jgi:hypothetical protein
MPRFSTMYLLSNAMALALLVLALVRPQWTRAGVVLLFFIAFTVNLRVAALHPAVYLRFGHVTPVKWYHDFILGWFALHLRPMLALIAVGQLAIAALLTGGPALQRVAVIGATIFLLAIAPLGMGAAFPFSLTVVAAMWIMLVKLHPAQPSVGGTHDDTIRS